MGVVEEIRELSHALQLQAREPWVILLGQRQAEELNQYMLDQYILRFDRGLLEPVSLEGARWEGIRIVTVDVPDLLQVKASPYVEEKWLGKVRKLREVAEEKLYREGYQDGFEAAVDALDRLTDDMHGVAAFGILSDYRNQELVKWTWSVGESEEERQKPPPKVEGRHW